eukprot:6199758-Pleurochrysis_carterae.AAC.5
MQLPLLRRRVSVVRGWFCAGRWLCQQEEVGAGGGVVPREPARARLRAANVLEAGIRRRARRANRRGHHRQAEGLVPHVAQVRTRTEACARGDMHARGRARL